jgi:hypothetical protein
MQDVVIRNDKDEKNEERKASYGEPGCDTLRYRLTSYAFNGDKKKTTTIEPRYGNEINKSEIY